MTGIPLNAASSTHVDAEGHEPVTVCSSGHDGWQLTGSEWLKTLTGFDELSVALLGTGESNTVKECTRFVVVVELSETEPLKRGARHETGGVVWAPPGRTLCCGIRAVLHQTLALPLRCRRALGPSRRAISYHLKPGTSIPNYTGERTAMEFCCAWRSFWSKDAHRRAGSYEFPVTLHRLFDIKELATKPSSRQDK